MAIIKCKMCGGDIELTADKTFGTCEFCGSTMTFPKVDDDQRAAAFNRGNHFRRIGEFDKALAVYERIVREDDTDAEAHWCCALCRFGIEYVEDPATYEWLPTCHRASFDSFLEDVDYLAAVEHSDGITKRQYQKDAAKIAEVQRGILATSQNAEPYDVFICYKESDENGDRTRDSLMAQDIYYQLTEQGRKVFFARITLEDVAGAQYEPYIFAALNSAKVMIVVGTKPEYLNAVWVKNEWRRFLAMMKKDRHKLLLPCYRDMVPYDMPEQLSVLQSYDMSKIGFIQDLTRGIAKVLDADKKPEAVKETVIVQQSASATNTAPLLKRAFMFLEDGDWSSADEYCEKVLDIEPENAEAYLGKLMANLRVRTRAELKNQEKPFDSNNNYRKVIRFADAQLRDTLSGYIQHINARNEATRIEGIYTNACRAMDRVQNTSLKDQAELYIEAAKLFASIRSYKDAAEQEKHCTEQSAVAREEREEARKAKIYGSAMGILRGAGTEKAFAEACKLFESISGWKDADEQAEKCRKEIEAIRAKEEAERLEYERSLAIAREKAALLREKAEIEAVEAAAKAREKAKKRKLIAAIVVPIFVALIVAAVIISNSVKKSNAYEFALSLVESGQYEDAIKHFTALGDYKDSAEQIRIIETTILEEQKAKAYADAIALMEAGKYGEAYAAFEALGSYKDSAEYLEKCSKVYVLLSKSSANGEITYEYADGVLVKETVVGKSSDGIGFQGFNFDKGSSGIAEYKYDSDGNCIEIRVYNDAGKLIKVTTREYDSNGNITKETQEMPLHDDVDTFIYAYDDNGNVTLRLWYQNLTGTGDVYSKHSYEYDEHNQLISETTWYEWDIERTIVYENEYDSNDQLVKQSSLSLVNKYSQTTEYEYDNNGNMIAQRVTNDYGSWEYTYAYDEFGNMIREFYSGASGSPSRTTTYTYGYIYTFE